MTRRDEGERQCAGRRAPLWPGVDVAFVSPETARLFERAGLPSAFDWDNTAFVVPLWLYELSGAGDERTATEQRCLWLRAHLAELTAAHALAGAPAAQALAFALGMPWRLL